MIYTSLFLNLYIRGEYVSNKIKELEEMAEIITIAIAREQASTRYYTEAFTKATTETAQRLFSLLIEQEKGHEAKLRAQLHEIQSEIEFEQMKSK
jgi:rubrerythrin